MDDRQGRPLALEVFEGDTADPSTVASQVEKHRREFGLESVVMVGHRGLLTPAPIGENLSPYEGRRRFAVLRVGKVLGRHKAGKRFRLAIGHDHFYRRRAEAKIDAEAALDGLLALLCQPTGASPLERKAEAAGRVTRRALGV